VSASEPAAAVDDRGTEVSDPGYNNGHADSYRPYRGRRGRRGLTSQAEFGMSGDGKVQDPHDAWRSRRISNLDFSYFSTRLPDPLSTAVNVYVSPL